MILGDNPAGPGFVLRDLVLIELSVHAPPSPAWGRGVKNFRKVFAGRGIKNFNFGGGGGGGYIVGREGGGVILLGGRGGVGNFEVKIKNA